MISKEAIKVFIERQLEEWDWLKKVPESELWNEVYHYYPSYEYLKFKPYKHQLVGLLLGMLHPSFLDFFDMGLGKAQPLDSKILTPKGWKLMRDIQVGDKVCTPTGKFSKVKQIFPQGKKEIFKVTFSDGTSTECCKDHLWAVITPDEKSCFKKNQSSIKYNILSLKKIQEKGLHYNIQKGLKNKRFFIPVTDPVEFNQTNLTFPVFWSTTEVSKILGCSPDCVRMWEKDNILKPTKIKNQFRYYQADKVLDFFRTTSNKRVKEWLKNNDNLNKFDNSDLFVKIDPYVLGVLIGDGSLVTSVEFTSSDTDVINEIKNLLPKQCTLTKHDDITYYIKNISKTKYHPIREILQSLQLFGKKSPKKFIPDCYKMSSISDRVALLQGLLDTDGYISKKGDHISYSTSSKKLAEDVKFLVQSLGGIVRERIEKTTHLDSYQLTLSLPESITPFRLKRKLHRVVKRKYLPYRGIDLIESVGFKDAQCIKLDTKEGLYLTNDFIVTHNSRTILDMISYRRFKGEQKKKILVLCQNTTMVGTWIDEVKLHTKFTTCGLTGTIVERWDTLNSVNADIYIINYPGFLRMLTYPEQVKGKKKVKRWVIDPKLVKEFSERFDALVLDEIHLCKNNESLTFKLCNHLAKKCKFRYGLTGTPFGKDPIDLWAQFYLIDRGETLGTNISIYKHGFFREIYNDFGKEWKFNEKNKDLLHSTIKNKSIRYEESEHLGLPPKVPSVLHVPFTDEALQYYKKAIEDTLHERKNSLQRKNRYHDLRKILAGFIDIKQPNDKTHRVVFRKNPRLETTLDLINNVPAGKKVIIFNEYTGSGDIIEEMLKKNKILYQRLYSETKDKDGARREFVANQNCKVFLANSKSGGVGLNLQVANYVIFYESPTDPIIRAQAEKRAHRSGQVNTVFYYDLVVKGSADEKILESISEGKDLFDAILNGDKELLTLKQMLESTKQEIEDVE